MRCINRNSIVLSILILLSCLCVRAQERQPLVRTIGVNGGTSTLLDNYLSPLDYMGWRVEGEVELSQRFKKYGEHLTWHNRYNLGYSQLINTPGTALMMAASVDLDYGVRYHFLPTKGLDIHVGGLTQLSAQVKYLSRNVNNPASASVSWDLRAHVGVDYQFGKKKFLANVGYDLESPFLGAMFVPAYSMSYYEYMLGAWDGSFHFASFHNRSGVNGRLHFDFILRTCTLRVQMQHNNLYWHANGLNFKRHDITYGLAVISHINYGRMK